MLKKLFVLLLIFLGLSGCGGDSEDILEERDILDEMRIEICKSDSIYSGKPGRLTQRDRDAAYAKFKELKVELENELASLPGYTQERASLETTVNAFNMSGWVSDDGYCDDTGAY